MRRSVCSSTSRRTPSSSVRKNRAGKTAVRPHAISHAAQPSEGRLTVFVERLSLKLELTIGMTPSVTVLAGDIKFVDVKLEPWGYSGEIEWWSVSREQSS